MKKLINFILALTFIVTHLIIELYPSIKMGAKIYVNKFDFNSLLNSEHLAEYVSYLSDEEKNELIKLIVSSCNNILD